MQGWSFREGAFFASHSRGAKLATTCSWMPPRRSKAKIFLCHGQQVLWTSSGNPALFLRSAAVRIRFSLSRHLRRQSAGNGAYLDWLKPASLGFWVESLGPPIFLGWWFGDLFCNGRERPGINYSRGEGQAICIQVKLFKWLLNCCSDTVKVWQFSSL